MTHILNHFNPQPNKNSRQNVWLCKFHFQWMKHSHKFTDWTAQSTVKTYSFSFSKNCTTESNSCKHWLFKFVDTLWRKNKYWFIYTRSGQPVLRTECLGGTEISLFSTKCTDGQQWGDWRSTLLTVDLGGRINSQQWEGQQSTVRRLTINSQQWEGLTVNSEAINDQQSTVRGLMVNSEAINDQQSTVRGSTVNSEAINDQQSTVRGSMVNSEAINNQQSTVRGSMVNSEAINDQQSTVRGSMVNSEAINDQQSTVRGSTVNSEVIDDQHCWLLIPGGEDQQSTVRGSTVKFEMHFHISK